MISQTDKLRMVVKIYLDVKEKRYDPKVLENTPAPINFMFDGQKCSVWPLKGYPVDVLIYRFDKWVVGSHHLIVDLGTDMFMCKLNPVKNFHFDRIEGEVELRLFREALLGCSIDDMLREGEFL